MIENQYFPLDSEMEVIRYIFNSFKNKDKNLSQITKGLHKKGLLYKSKYEFDDEMVSEILSKHYLNVEKVNKHNKKFS